MKDATMTGYSSIPLPVLDGTTSNTDIMTRITLIFPRSMSLTQLQESWFALVRTWPLLAARIRSTPSTPSGLSYFVPSPATLVSLEARSRESKAPLEKHIALVDASRSIESYHSIVGKAVKSSLSATEISVGSAPEKKEQDATTCSNACTSFKQLLVTDQAFVTAQATKWTDATSVTISFSHTLGDAFSIKSIFTAWEQALKGETVDALEGVGTDPFIKYLPSESETEGELPLGFYKYGFVKKVKLVANMLWDIQVRRPEKQIAQFYIHIPQSQVQALIEEAKADLERLRLSDLDKAGDVEKARSYNVSTFNVLFAWLLQNIHAANPKPRKSSAVVTIVNAKTRPPSGHTPSDYPPHQMWGGAFGAPLNPLTSGEYSSLPLGQVALHIRESLQAQVEPDNIRKSIRMALKHTLWKKPSGKLIFFTNKTNSYWCGCTEWRSVKFGEVDFAAAAASTGSGTVTPETDAKLNPVAMAASMELPMTARNRWVLFGDAGGGVWFSGAMTGKEARNKRGFGRYEWV